MVSESSQLGRQSFIGIADFKCLHAVATDNWQSMEIYNRKLDLISNFRFLYH